MPVPSPSTGGYCEYWQAKRRGEKPLRPITEAPRDGSAFRAVVDGGERVTVRRLNGSWCYEDNDCDIHRMWRNNAFAGWLPESDVLDLYETLALAASELKSTADTIYAARCPTEEMLAAARAAGVRAVETIDEWRNRT